MGVSAAARRGSPAMPAGGACPSEGRGNPDGSEPFALSLSKGTLPSTVIPAQAGIQRGRAERGRSPHPCPVTFKRTRPVARFTRNLRGLTPPDRRTFQKALTIPCRG